MWPVTQEPLRAIGIFTEVLIKNTRDKLNEGTDESARYILEGVARMKKLIKDLLDYATASHAEDEPARLTDLNDVVDSAIAHLNLAISEAGATIACDGLPSVNTNENGILRVFYNLIGNAIKYHSSEQHAYSHLGTTGRGSMDSVRPGQWHRIRYGLYRADLRIVPATPLECGCGNVSGIRCAMTSSIGCRAYRDRHGYFTSLAKCSALIFAKFRH